jgi:hypothetical protein
MADKCKVTNSPSRNNGGMSAALCQWACPHERSKNQGWPVISFLKHPPGRSVFGNASQTTQVINIPKKLVPK